MLTKIKSWFQNRKLAKQAQNDTLTVSNTVPNSYVTIWQDSREDADMLKFTAPNGEDIFCIDASGKAKWLKEDTYDEAAEVFLTAMNWRIEEAAGIQQSRIEWEKHITKTVVDAAEKQGGSLTAEELTDVVRKSIMYDKLRGKYGEN